MPARVLISAEELRSAVKRLAGELSDAYNDGVILVAVLKGSVCFLADYRSRAARFEKYFTSRY